MLPAAGGDIGIRCNNSAAAEPDVIGNNAIYQSICDASQRISNISFAERPRLQAILFFFCLSRLCILRLINLPDEMLMYRPALQKVVGILLLTEMKWK